MNSLLNSSLTTTLVSLFAFNTYIPRDLFMGSRIKKGTGSSKATSYNKYDWKNKIKLPKRNEPCLCGSGLKFKKCCIDKYNSLGQLKEQYVPDSEILNYSCTDIIKYNDGKPI